MKKKALKVLMVILTITCICMMSVSFVSAGNTISVKLEIEGPDSCFFYGNISVDTDNLAGAMKEADSENDKFTMDWQPSQYGDYLTEVNGIKSATFLSQNGLGYDGWMFKINGTALTSGASATTIKDGDAIVLYYSDEYGVGMQYPEIDLSQAEKGILTFTSQDASYNSDGSVSYIKKPVTEATVTLDGTEYLSDESGSITVPSSVLTTGYHSIQIEKSTSYGCPLVLRFSPDAAICVSSSENGETSFAFTSMPQDDTTDTSAEVTTATPGSQSSETEETTNTSTPKTGGPSLLIFIVLIIASAAVSSIAFIARKNENK